VRSVLEVSTDTLEKDGNVCTKSGYRDPIAMAELSLIVDQNFWGREGRNWVIQEKKRDWRNRIG
jgi:hypothetical protein